MARYDDPYAGERISAQKEVGLAQAAAHQAGTEVQASATRDAANLAAASRVAAARTAIVPEMNRQEGLGDIGSTYGGGKLDLATTAQRAPLIPAGTGPETGRWENVEGGIQATEGDGTYNRPAHREVVLPTHVIRGISSTYAGGAPGEEWGSLTRAAQAVNRATGQGEYAPPGAAAAALQHKYKLEEIAATGKAMEAQGGLAAQSQKGATDYLSQMLMQQHGIEEKDAKGNPTGNRALAPYAREAMLKILPQVKTMQDVPAILERIGPELKLGKELDSFNNPTSREGLRADILTNYRQQAQAAGRIPEPGTENYIKTAPVTKDNLFWFKQFQGSKTVPQSLSLKNAATAAPTATEPWANERPIPWRAVLPERSLPLRAGLPLRAEGGPVDEDQAYIVGEKGPEVFVPATKGTVLPNMDLSALAPVQQTQYDEVALAGKG